jgi:hypothetical protein
MTRAQFEHHPTIGYRFIPGLKTRVDHTGQCAYLVRANAQGFRADRDFVVAKPRGVFRVLLFGDSFTAGDGVSNGKRYSDILEQMLPSVEIYNLALPGTGTDQQYLIFREFGAALEYDLVVIAVQVENINRVNARFRQYADDKGQPLVYAKPYFRLGADGQLQLLHVPTPAEPLRPHEVPGDLWRFVDGATTSGRFPRLRRIVNRLGPGIKQLVQRGTRYQPLPGYHRADDPRWILMKAILVQWIRECRAPVILFPIPLYHYVEEMASPNAYRERFKELGELDNVTIHDPLDEFLKRPMTERRALRFPLDPHPTLAGHEALAESLAPVIQSFNHSDR